MNKQDWIDTFFYINNEPKTSLTLEQEKALRDLDIITDCELEFGPHDDHGDCRTIMNLMGASDY